MRRSTFWGQQLVWKKVEILTVQIQSHLKSKGFPPGAFTDSITSGNVGFFQSHLRDIRLQDFDRHYDSSNESAPPAPNLFSSEGLSGLKRVASVTASGIKDGFIEASQNCWTGKTGVDLAFGVGSGLLLSLDTAATTRGGSALMKIGVVVTVASAVLGSEQDVIAAAKDAYCGSANLDADADCMKKTLGQGVFDAFVVTAASHLTHTAGEKLGMGISASGLDKMRQNPLFEDSKLLTNLETREARLTSGSRGSRTYDRNLLNLKDRQKYQSELKTFPLHHMFGFENDALINTRSNTTTWEQERTITTLGDYLGTGIFARNVVGARLQSSVEEAFAERLIYGETDNHLYNLGLKGIAPHPPIVSDSFAYNKAVEETMRVSNLDFHYCFGRTHPRGYASGDVPIWGNLGNQIEHEHSRFIGAPVSEPLMNKIDAFKEKYGVKEVMSTGLSRSQAKALMKRVNWFSENRRFPGKSEASDSLAGKVREIIYGE